MLNNSNFTCNNDPNNSNASRRKQMIYVPSGDDHLSTTLRAAEGRAADVRAADERAAERAADERAADTRAANERSCREGAREGVRGRATRRSSRMGFSSSFSSPVHNSAINWIYLPNSLQIEFHKS